MASKPTIEVWWGWQTARDRTEIEEIFASHGLAAQARDVTTPTGGEPGIIVEIVVGGALLSFFHGYFEAAGQDGWKQTKHLVERSTAWFIKRSNLRPPGDKATLVFRGRHWWSLSSVIHLESNLPDEAYRALASLPFRSGRIYSWDRRREIWVSRYAWKRRPPQE